MVWSVLMNLFRSPWGSERLFFAKSVRLKTLLSVWRSGPARWQGHFQDKALRLGPAIKLKRLPEAEESFYELDMFAVGRKIADYQAAWIRRHLPDFFRHGAIDYENMFKFRQQIAVASTELEFLFRSFQVMGTRKSPPLMVDPLVMPTALAEALGQGDMPTYQSVYSKSPAPVQAGQFQKNKRPLALPTFSRKTVLLTMSAPVHLEWARSAIEALEEEYQVVIFAAPNLKMEPDQYAALASRYPVVEGATLAMANQQAEALAGFFNQRLRQIQALSAPPEVRAFLAFQLTQLLPSLQLLGLMETLLDRLQPAAILGCYEKNQYGLIFGALQERYGYKLLNFQHGIMPTSRNLEYFRFDRFFVWNPLTRNVVLKDGYPAPETLAVVGNPSWEQGSAGKSGRERSDKYEELLQWRGDSPLLGAYTQYSKDYLTQGVRTAYLESLFSYLEARPEVKLLIKKHPLETDRHAETVLSRTGLSERVRICVGGDLPLAESFELVDLSTTPCSTCVLDSLAVGVPAVALDFTNIIGRIGYGYDTAVPIVLDPAEVPARLDAMLAESRGSGDEPQGEPNRFVFPEFSDSYAMRMREHLAELGLLARRTVSKAG